MGAVICFGFMISEKMPAKMLYPYTFGAKLWNYPYKWHWQNSRHAKFLLASFVVCQIFVFNKLHWAGMYPQPLIKIGY